METSPLAYTQAEQKIVERFFTIAGKRTKTEIAERQASEKAVRATILPLLAQFEGDALLDLFAWLEVVATKTNAARIASHPLRRAADGAAIDKRKAALGEGARGEAEWCCARRERRGGGPGRREVTVLPGAGELAPGYSFQAWGRSAGRARAELLREWSNWRVWGR